MPNTIEINITARGKAARRLDSINEKLAELDRNLGRAGDAAKKFAGKMDDAGEKVDEAGDKSDEAGEKTHALGEAHDFLAGVLTVGTVVAAGKAALELGKLGAQAQRSRRSLISLAGGAQQADKYVRAVQDASFGTIAKMDAMQSATTALTLGVVENADQMQRLTEIAVTLGQAQGLTATQAVSDLTTALGRQSPMILDNLGITMKASEAYAGYAEDLGKTVSQLTNAEKRQAFVNEALEEGAEVAEKLGGVQEDSAAQIEQATAAWKDLRVELGERLAPAMGNAASGFSTLLTWNEKIQRALGDHSKEVAETAETYTDYAEEMDRAAEHAGYQVDAQGHLIKQTQKQWIVVEKIIDANYELSETEYAVAHGAQTVEHGINAAYIQMGAYHRELRQTSDATGPAAAALQETADSAYDLAEAGGSVVEKFADLDFDTQALYEMAISMGANAEQVIELGLATGNLTEQQAEAIETEYGIVKAFVDGKTSAEEATTTTRRYMHTQQDLGIAQHRAADAAADNRAAVFEHSWALRVGSQEASNYSGKMGALQGANRRAQSATIRARGAIQNQARAMESAKNSSHTLSAGVDAVGSAGEGLRKKNLPRSFDAIGSAAGGARGKVSGLKQEIEQIPASKTVTITIRKKGGVGPGLQSGGIAQAGRPYIVGEAGPELFMPGTTGRVLSNQVTRRVVNNNSTQKVLAPIIIDSSQAYDATGALDIEALQPLLEEALQ